MKLESYTRRELFEQIPSLENKKILDLGSSTFCLYGYAYLDAIQSRIGKEKADTYDGNVVAVDLDYDPFLGSFMKGTSVKADAVYIPIQDQHFDIVAAGRILNEFRKNDNELSRVLGEINRVLKYDGHLIGDITLFPQRPCYERLRIHKFIIDWPRYMRQIKKYSRKMEEKGFKFLRKGIGFNEENYERYVNMIFVTQKI